jgi:lysophospholipase L1-like esterase
MKLNKLLGVAVSAGMLFSFIYGVTSVQYKVFPYKQIMALKNIVSPKPKYSNYFYHKKSFFEQNGARNYDVVFIGDSITDGAEWQDLFPSIRIANRGINGDRTDGILNRLDSIYSTSADRAFIMVGVNDFGRGVRVDEVFENYRTIVNKLSEQGMKVYIQSTIYTSERLGRRNIKITALNKKLELLAKQKDSVTYIDLNAGLAKDSLLNPMYSRDGLHLNGKGYAVWKGIIGQYVK